MMDARDLSEKLPGLRVRLARTLQHEGAADALTRLMPLFLGFLEHGARLHRETSPEAREKLEALRTAALGFAERIRAAEGEPIERIRGYVVNALTPTTAPASTYADDGLVRTAVATAVDLDAHESTRRVIEGLPAKELINSTVQQTEALVRIIEQVLNPTGGPDQHAREVVACGVAEVLADNGIEVSPTASGAFDATLRDVLGALGSSRDEDLGGLLEVGAAHARSRHVEEPS